jgi:hypothetical protein
VGSRETEKVKEIQMGKIRVSVVNNAQGFNEDILVNEGTTAVQALAAKGISVTGTGMGVTVNGDEVDGSEVLEEGDTVGYVPKKLSGHLS